MAASPDAISAPSMPFKVGLTFTGAGIGTYDTSGLITGGTYC